MKFVFDECLPARFTQVLRIVFSQDSTQIAHLVDDLGFGGVADPVWLSKIGAGEPCVLITRDSALRRVYIERAAWQKAGHVVFFLPKQWRHAKFVDTTWMLIRWWPVIAEAAPLARPGIAYRVPFRAKPSSLYPFDDGDPIP